MIKAVLFDLDGTLLPMDQRAFTDLYMNSLAAKMATLGCDPKDFLCAMGKGIAAMIGNDGTVTNQERFWQAFCEELGEEARAYESVIDGYYAGDFLKIRFVCGYTPEAKKTVDRIHSLGLDTVLATNAVFPPIGAETRLRWSGLEPKDFRYITTYDNSHYCKPNPAYFQEIADKLGLLPQECLMVGNDVEDDMTAEQTGMKVFLLFGCLRNAKAKNLSRYPQGGFQDLLDYIISENGQKESLPC